MAGEVLLITSGKGGVGKTTFASNIGPALARRGRRVLLIDANFGLRNLDIALNLAPRVIYDLYDVTEGKCGEEKALVPHARYPGLCLVGAPQDAARRRIDPGRLKVFVTRMKERFDHIFIDCAAGVGEAFCTAAAASDKAVIITVPTLLSMRDAEKVSLCLEDGGITEFKLVVNRVDPKRMKKKGAVNIDDMIDGVRCGLLGIIPEDKRLERDMAMGKEPFLDYYVKANTAFSNIARRILKEEVPLMKIK